MSIERLTGSAIGRNRVVGYENLAQLDQNLADAGSDKSCILSATVYITDITQKTEMDSVWNPWIGPDNWPQRACLGVALAEGDLVEITLVAAKS